MEPSLVEECTLVRLVPSLEKVAKELRSDTGQNDLFVALLIVIMREADFRLVENDQRLETGDSVTLEPNEWMSPCNGRYLLRFEHYNELLECKIVGIPVGDVFIINLCPLRFPCSEVTRTRSAAFQTLKYVNPYSSDLAGRFRNLRELAHRKLIIIGVFKTSRDWSTIDEPKFKDSLTTPMKGEILTNAGITNASLTGLPTELKLIITRFLGLQELGRLAQTCRAFHNIVGEPIIWEKLLTREFGSPF